MFADSRRQAILTRYHAATNTKPSRISATCQAERIYVSYDQGISDSDCHRIAAEALAVKLGRNGDYTAGWLPNGDAVWVSA